MPKNKTIYFRSLINFVFIRKVLIRKFGEKNQRIVLLTRGDNINMIRATIKNKLTETKKARVNLAF